MRKFEKISFSQFSKDISNSKELYAEYKLPIRKTQYSAGYDFLAIEDINIKPGQIVKVPTGYKVRMQTDEALIIIVRGSIGFKYNVRMCNQVGLIESDYYNNISNEGHMFIALQNEGENELLIKKGEGYAQGVFTKFLLTEDDAAVGHRKGGFGSTNEREEENE